MATVSAVQLVQKKNSKGEARIYLRFEASGSRVYSSLRRSVLVSHWNERAGRVRSSHRYSAEINEDIVKAIDKANKCLFEMERLGFIVTAKTWKSRYSEGSHRSDFWVYADKWLEEKRKRNQIYYWRRAKATLKKLDSCLGRPLPWPNLNASALGRWDLYLESKLNNSAATRVIAHNVIKTIVNDAVRDDIIEPNDNPYFKFRLPKARPTKRVALSIEQFNALVNLDLVHGSIQDVSRDMFAVSVLARGLRFGDTVKLRWEDIKDQRIQIVASKTGDHLSIPVDERIKAIINKYDDDNRSTPYIFPALGMPLTAEREVAAISSFNARVNKALKELGEMINLPETISFHCARHTFAYVAKLFGLSNWEIQDLLKHKKSSTTDRYLKSLEQDSLDMRAASIFESR